MYLIKNFKANISPIGKKKKEEAYIDTPEGRIDYWQFYEEFDFRNLIHKDKLLFLKNVYQRDSAFIPDLMASIYAQMVKVGVIHPHNLLSGISFCRDLLGGKGYQEKDLDSLMGFIKTNSSPKINNVFLVAGCQGRQMIFSRVAKAFDASLAISKKFKSKNTIVFSGKNPKKSENKIHYECERMLRIFSQLQKDRKIRGDNIPERFTVELESESGTTKENIAKLFEDKRKFVKTNMPNNIFIVSSTFHLIRLAEALEEYLEKEKNVITKENGGRFRNNKVKIPQIDNIILVGSENESHEFDVGDFRYAKLMMFDVYDSLFRRLKVLEHERK